MRFVMPHTVIKFRLIMFCQLIYHFIKTQLSFTYLHHQPLISCGAKCYFSKLGYQLFLVVFLKKIENQIFIFFRIVGP